MRTTVTLDNDVVQLLRAAMHRTRRSFKETLNAALRAGLTGGTPRVRKASFKVQARALGLRAGLDPAGFNKWVDDLELDAFVAQTGKLKRAR
jgi:hypothetical protein